MFVAACEITREKIYRISNQFMLKWISQGLLHEPDSIRTGTAARPLPGIGMLTGLERAGRLQELPTPTSTASRSDNDNGPLHNVFYVKHILLF